MGANGDDRWWTTEPETWWTDEPIRSWWVRWYPQEGFVRVGRNVYAPRLGVVEVYGWRGFDVEVVARPSWDGFECDEFTMRRGGYKDARAVDYDALRSVPITAVLSPAIASLVYFEPPDFRVQWRPGVVLDEDVRALWRTDRDAAVRWVAAVYEIARAGGMGPREAVQQAFDTSRTTSSRMVALARSAGALVDGPVDLADVAEDSKLRDALGRESELVTGWTHPDLDDVLTRQGH